MLHNDEPIDDRAFRTPALLLLFGVLLLTIASLLSALSWLLWMATIGSIAIGIWKLRTAFRLRHAATLRMAILCLLTGVDLAIINYLDSISSDLVIWMPVLLLVLPVGLSAAISALVARQYHWSSRS